MMVRKIIKANYFLYYVTRLNQLMLFAHLHLYIRLQVATQDHYKHDISMITLIKGHTIHQNIPVLTGKCPNCVILYIADHEKYKDIKVQKSDQTRD